MPFLKKWLPVWGRTGAIHPLEILLPAVILNEAQGVKDPHLFLASRPVLFRVDYHAAVHEGSYFTYIMASQSRTARFRRNRNLHQPVFEHKWKERDGFTAR